MIPGAFQKIPTRKANINIFPFMFKSSSSYNCIKKESHNFSRWITSQGTTALKVPFFYLKPSLNNPFFFLPSTSTPFELSCFPVYFKILFSINSLCTLDWRVTFDPNEVHEPKQPTYKCSSESVLIYHWEIPNVKRLSGAILRRAQSPITKRN